MHPRIIVQTAYLFLDIGRGYDQESSIYQLRNSGS
ncbi:hypothetical protein BD809_105258 [Aquimarina intermedia]|uniref:Uncharacterized protein n=1 Tax=Aquimarina intermedia TaxID=350814 RepID=A0A5S5C2Z7_9FLAO|nr:hypothetical protein BD809_105258 [Aquimarina intermedia]